MNYATLKADIASYLNRTDLNDVIPTFIRLAESRFNRVIRTRRMIVRSKAEIDTQFSVLPTDFCDLRNIQLNADTIRILEYVTPQYMDSLRIRGESGDPKYFTIIGNQVEVYPTPSLPVEIEIAYYARIPALTDVANTNWLLENSYDLYLYGSLAMSAPWLREDERIATWAGLSDTALEELKLENDRHDFFGTTPQMRGRAIG